LFFPVYGMHGQVLKDYHKFAVMTTEPGASGYRMHDSRCSKGYSAFN
jgi:hypothetical protein